MPTPKEILKLSRAKAIRLEKLIDEVEAKISNSSEELSRTMLEKFLEKLTIEQGRIKSQINQQLVSLFNKAYQDYLLNKKLELIKSIAENISTILGQNHDYYRQTVPRFDINKSDMERIVNRRLGINADGTFSRNGYMGGLLDDAPVRAEIQKYVFREIFKGSSLESLKKGLREFIVGEPDKFGVFQRYYRTFSYDVYAQLSSFTSGQYAQKLGLTFFIYNGGLIKTSREFCIKRNAEVYSTQEAEKWKDDPDLTAIDNRESYNWLIDRGGFNCRHTIDFIAQEVAVVLRPDLRDQ